MNIPGLVQSQKRSVAVAMMPNLLSGVRKPSAAYAAAPTAYSLTFANKAIGGRLEELVQPQYILRTGVF